MYAIKINTKCQAWELGSGSKMEREMISKGKICLHPDNTYEIFSLEAQGGEGQIAKAGDYLKVDFRGWPQPCKREWFHILRSIRRNTGKSIMTVIMK